jgi:hypothetical protein
VRGLPGHGTKRHQARAPEASDGQPAGQGPHHNRAGGYNAAAATGWNVDWVGINESPDAVSAIETIRPSVYVKGQDYVNPQGDITGKITYERNAVEAHGGCILFTDEVTFSSTELINRHFNGGQSRGLVLPGGRCRHDAG